MYTIPPGCYYILKSTFTFTSSPFIIPNTRNLVFLYPIFSLLQPVHNFHCHSRFYTFCSVLAAHVYHCYPCSLVHNNYLFNVSLYPPLSLPSPLSASLPFCHPCPAPIHPYQASHPPMSTALSHFQPFYTFNRFFILLSRNFYTFITSHKFPTLLYLLSHLSTLSHSCHLPFLPVL